MLASYLNLKTGYGGYCLQWVRLVLGVPAKFGTAWKAWNGSKLRLSGPKPPKGVPVFFRPSANGFGHVAISMGGGKCRTTNAATNRITTVTIASLAASWRQPYVGYAYDLNGVLVVPTITQTLRKGAKGIQVEYLQAVLKWEGFYGGMLDGSFGPATDKAVRAYQKARRLVADGSVGPATRKSLNQER